MPFLWFCCFSWNIVKHWLYSFVWYWLAMFWKSDYFSPGSLRNISHCLLKVNVKKYTIAMNYVLIRLTNKDNFVNGLLNWACFPILSLPLQGAQSSAISVSAIALKFQDSAPGFCISPAQVCKLFLRGSVKRKGFDWGTAREEQDVCRHPWISLTVKAHAGIWGAKILRIPGIVMFLHPEIGRWDSHSVTIATVGVLCNCFVMMKGDL